MTLMQAKPPLSLPGIPAAIVFFAVLGGIAQYAAARPAKDEAIIEFVLGNLEYVLLHELAHVLINDLDVPIVGPEENAADYIATTVLLRADQFDPSRAERARGFLLATADGLATSWEMDEGSGGEIRYWDTHSLTIQRFYHIICLVYGSNPQMFAELPAQVAMPPDRAARCPREFERADRALQWLLATYGRQAADPPGAEVSINIEDPPTRVSARVVAAMTASGMLTNVVRRLRETFALPGPIQISIRRCRRRQAAWLPEKRELVLCYELIDNYYYLGVQRRGRPRLSKSGEIG